MNQDLIDWIKDPVNYLNYNKLQNRAFWMPYDAKCPNFVPKYSFEHYCPNFEFENNIIASPTRGSPMEEYVYYLFS